MLGFRLRALRAHTNARHAYLPCRAVPRLVRSYATDEGAETSAPVEKATSRPSEKSLDQVHDAAMDKDSKDHATSKEDGQPKILDAMKGVKLSSSNKDIEVALAGHLTNKLSPRERSRQTKDFDRPRVGGKPPSPARPRAKDESPEDRSYRVKKLTAAYQRLVSQRNALRRKREDKLSFLRKRGKTVLPSTIQNYYNELGYLETQMEYRRQSLQKTLPPKDYEEFMASVTPVSKDAELPTAHFHNQLEELAAATPNTLESLDGMDIRSEAIPARTWPAARKTNFTPQRTLQGGAGLREVDSLARKVGAMRSWALISRKQADRAARTAGRQDADDEAKLAAEVLEKTAQLAMGEFQGLREAHKGTLTPAQLRDIEVTEEGGRGGSKLSAQDVDEMLASGSSFMTYDDRYVSELSGKLSARDMPIKPVKPPRDDAKVARLANQLQRVLFSPGVHYLRDPRTGVWNFPTEFAKIPTPEEFNFDSIPPYVTASKDPELAKLGQADGIKYIGSTSTVTSSLSQIYFTINGGVGLDTDKLPKPFAEGHSSTFTAGALNPAAVLLWPQENGRYAIDSDKRYAIDENILSSYGNILEKILTTEISEWWRSLKGAGEGAVTHDASVREAYAYSRGGSLLIRSQLDCQDNRLPGSGTFDIKTRACMPIRNDRANHLAYRSYDIAQQHGPMNSFDREMFDLSKSGMIKYCLQARIGDMDGIFVAYHNTARCFGFEYLPRTELDERLWGSADVGDQVYSILVGFFERIMNLATGFFPNEPVSVVMYQRQDAMTSADQARSPREVNELIVAVQPLHLNGRTTLPTRAMRIQMVNNLDGKDIHPSKGIKFFAEDEKERRNQVWKVNYDIAITPDDAEGHESAKKIRDVAVGRMTAMNRLVVPAGLKPSEMYNEPQMDDKTADKSEDAAPGVNLSFQQTQWVEPTPRHVKLRETAKAVTDEYRKREATWNDVVKNMSSSDPEPETRPQPYVIPDFDFKPTVFNETVAERKERAPRPSSIGVVEEFIEASTLREAAEASGEDEVGEVEEDATSSAVPGFVREIPPHVSRDPPAQRSQVEEEKPGTP